MRSGLFKNALAVEFEIGKRVDYRVTLEIGLNQLLALLILLKHIKTRLIGDMEEAFFIESALLELFYDRRDKLREKALIFLAHRIAVPAEIFSLSSVDLNDYLRRGFRSPLRKEMRYLVVFNAESLCHIYPTVKLIKSEGISSAFVKLNINELVNRYYFLHSNKRLARQIKLILENEQYMHLSGDELNNRGASHNQARNRITRNLRNPKIRKILRTSICDMLTRSATQAYETAYKQQSSVGNVTLFMQLERVSLGPLGELNWYFSIQPSIP